MTRPGIMQWLALALGALMVLAALVIVLAGGASLLFMGPIAAGFLAVGLLLVWLGLRPSLAGPPSPMRLAMGRALLTGSVLWLLLAGGCTLFFAGTGAVGMMKTPQDDYAAAVLVVALVAGVPALAPALLLYLLGRSLTRARDGGR